MTWRGFRDVVRVPEFDRDLARLTKRFPTLEDDLSTLIGTSLLAFHKLGLNMGIVRIDGLGRTRLPVYKVRKFACQSLKGRGTRSGLRLIYAFDVESDCIKLIEIYFKAAQENENRERIRHYV